MCAIDLRPPEPAAAAGLNELHLGLLDNLQRVVDLDPEVSDGALKYIRAPQVAFGAGYTVTGVAVPRKTRSAGQRTPPASGLSFQQGAPVVDPIKNIVIIAVPALIEPNIAIPFKYAPSHTSLNNCCHLMQQ